MADEAVLIYEIDQGIPFTVTDGTGIEKGAILKMTDLMTAALSDGAEDVVAGIARSEKIADDGVTKLSVYRRGIFKVRASGSITVGDALITAMTIPNTVKTAGLNAEDIIGIALETATTNETFLMELGPRTINVA